MNIVKLSDCLKHATNPFHDGTLQSLNIRKFPIQPQGPMVNTESGEIVTGNVYIHKKFGYLDTEPNVKLFQNVSDTLLNLSGSGVKMFFYVVSQLTKGSERVYIAPHPALKFTGYQSNKDVYKGIAELIAYQVIAKTEESLMYYVNPNLIFAGNKANLIQKD